MKNEQEKTEWMQKPVVVWLGAMLCCFLWGSAFPCIKIGYKLWEINSLDTASQILFAGMRFLLAGILAIVLGSMLERRFLKPEQGAAGKILWLSLLQTVAQYMFFYIGLAHTSGVKASIIEAVNVFVAILVSGCLFRQETIHARQMIGCLIGFAGVVLINLNGVDFHMQANGEGFILLLTIAYAFSSVFLKRYSAKHNPVMLSGYQFIAGGIILILCGLLLKYNPVSKVAVFGFMNPVFGVILSAWLLDEREQAFGVLSIISLALVCVGIYIVNKRNENC